MYFCYREGKTEPPAAFVPYHKMNAVAGYLNHYKNFLYLRFILENPRSTPLEKRQANREEDVAVQEGKKVLHNQWRRR